MFYYSNSEIKLGKSRVVVRNPKAGQIKMLMPRLSFGKLVHVSSILMTLLLAMNMHALAGHLKEDDIESGDPTPQPAISAAQPPPTENPTVPETHRPAEVQNTIEGWTSVLSSDTRQNPPAPSNAAPVQKAAQVGQMGASPHIHEIDPVVDTAEAGLVKDILTRQPDIDQQKKNLEDQKRVIDAANQALNEKMRVLDNSMASVAEKQAAQQETMSAETDRLVKIYEEMPPREAAAIFNIMDIHVLVSIANKMAPRKISSVMGYMMPERVNIVSQYMAGVRTFRPSHPPSDGMSGQTPDSGAAPWWSKSRTAPRQVEEESLKLSRQ
ncbi:MotE family protein [Gluconacetobacter takamatsuzukensis]|uniref:Flagellar motility protein MotE (MotC chaperone) n=1 Tax=Gluconacetobacter takamatsuzukensis TaxID=1286190 RepID=A0A7W4PPG9_9PROT|nr:hypothetical protein [Gluconacetobacter takamatsuzukensis]MBB2203619.1 hypothetical protein [Gluconacetobacter takamatsuzukensis]